MKIAFPVEENNGLESQVFGHFGSAPGFAIVDTVTKEIVSVANGDGSGQHRGCQAVALLGGYQVDAVAVGGIGGGALQKLQNQGLRVFQARQGTVRENLDFFLNEELPEVPGPTCGGHGDGHHHH